MVATDIEDEDLMKIVTTAVYSGADTFQHRRYIGIWKNPQAGK